MQAQTEPDSGERSRQVDALGHIAGQIAHEINNRLTVVLGNLSLLTYLLEDHPDPDLKSSLDDTLNAAQGIREEISRLQTITNGFAPQRSLHHAGELLQEVVSRWLSEDRHCDLQLGESLPLIKADPQQVELAVHNLLDNAWEANPAGAITVWLENFDVPGDGNLTADCGPAVEIRVEDQAGGIPPEVRGALFEPYVTTKNESLGIGLAVTASIARRHHGQVLFEPREAGSCFRLILPAYRQ